MNAANHHHCFTRLDELLIECRRLLGLLEDPDLQRVALCKMEGFTVEEIAAELGCVPRTVKRRLQLIRRTWQEEAAP
jgi:DNA-directed RNA polymerase specialized sigma24 family protein